MRWSARSAPRSAACHRLEAARQARPPTSGHAEPAMTCTRLFGAADRATPSIRHWQPVSVEEPEESDMAKGEQRGNRETKKPKKQKIKTIAAAPSQKTAGWQPGFASGKKK